MYMRFPADLAKVLSSFIMIVERDVWKFTSCLFSLFISLHLAFLCDVHAEDICDSS